MFGNLLLGASVARFDSSPTGGAGLDRPNSELK